MNIELEYLAAMDRIVCQGNRRTCRNGDTMAVFAHQLRHDMKQGFPLLTTKTVNWRTVLGELLWFIEGGRRTNWRMSNNRFREILGKEPGAPTIWSHDQEKEAWLKKAQFPGDCGRIYGSQWRHWNGRVDQLVNLVSGLKLDPFSRHHKVTAWNPADTGEMCLPPCHGDFQCFVRQDGGARYLSLHMNQRSCDMFLGVPFNIASYGFLLHMLAQVTGMVADELVVTLNDAHIYVAHLEAVLTQLEREPRPLPDVELASGVMDLDRFTMEDIQVRSYYPHSAIKAPLL